MTIETLKAYLDGWSVICDNTEETVAAMLAGADPDIRFTDINSPNEHRGHEGIRKISAISRGKYPGARIDYRDLLFDGRNWSIRWTFSGPRPDGTRFAGNGASAGRVGVDGKVVEHTDYWNRAAMLAG